MIFLVFVIQIEVAGIQTFWGIQTFHPHWLAGWQPPGDADSEHQCVRPYINLGFNIITCTGTKMQKSWLCGTLGYDYPVESTQTNIRVTITSTETNEDSLGEY